ncbi:hypothetical protein [Bosea sp. MMO-172]
MLSDDAIGYEDTQSSPSKMLWRAALVVLVMLPAALIGCALLAVMK